MCPAYLITHPDYDKPVAVEAANPRRARAYAARSFTIKRLNSREVFELGQRDIELTDITGAGKG